MHEIWKLTRDNWFSLFTTAILAVFLILFPRHTENAKTLFYLLCLIGLGQLILQFRNAGQIDSGIRAFFICIALYFLWSVFCFYFNDQPGSGRSMLWNRYFHLLMVIPLYFLFARVKPDFDLLLITLSLSSLIVVVEIMWEIYLGNQYRFQGMNSNSFAPILLGYACFMLFSFLFIDDRRRRVLALSGFILAMIAVILSLSKGAWLAVPVITVYFVFYLPGSWSRMKRIWLLITLLALIVSSYLLPPVKYRVDLAIGNATQYFATDNVQDPSRIGTAGIRFEMWKSAWKSFLENPVTGVGPGGFKPSVIRNAERFDVNKVVTRFEHPHNQYLNVLATRGIPGLVLLLAVILLPICIAFRTRRFDQTARIAGASLTGICLTYLTANLFDDHLEYKPTIVFFVLMSGLLLGRIGSQVKVSSVERDEHE